MNHFESRLTHPCRPVKTATQRLIVFIASPIANEVEELVQVRFLFPPTLNSHFAHRPDNSQQVAKKLKKMQVNVDIVNFGETSSNTSKVFPSA
jgi:hypothetical protein